MAVSYVHKSTNSQDKLNNLYTSKNPDDILNFYKNFDNTDELIKWMERRPKAKVKYFEEDGDTDAVVVILTKDHNSKRAIMCKDIYKGQKIVFVQSNGKYFNYASSSNKGIQYALKFKPKFVILSNDDMFKIDDIKKLKKELQLCNPQKYKIIFANGFAPHAYQSFIGKGRFWLTAYRYLRSKTFREYQKDIDKFNITLYYQLQFNYISKVFFSMFFKPITKFYCTGAFSIFSSNFIRELGGRLFDETYINGLEDVDLSVRLKPEFYKFINFSIGTLGGQSLGVDFSRKLRDVANLTYFNHKILNGGFHINK